ncbi:Cytochrome P450 714C2 [Camellia lanceoleosa]|uniref:Cytochrome P450 714C2 n=1 Tax=Camellia lanceoleosa TaxID=1840588 RepID=A0ACC0HNW0_9ERIC|nr:Cytochrome P450 714C2 [Camellia lanceoleosa]
MELLFKSALSVGLLFLTSFILYLFNRFWVRPQRLRSKLRTQGLRGRSPSFLLGNIPDFIKFQPQLLLKMVKPYTIGLDYPFHYSTCGRRYNFDLGTYQVAYITDPHLAKEISLFTSLKLGKTFFLQKNSETLLIAPEFYADKVQLRLTKEAFKSSKME